MLEKPINPNYAATVVKIENIQPVAGLDNLVKTLIFSNAVLVGKDTQISDLGLFFPVECALSQEFLHNNNLFKDSTLNVNKEKKGYFEQHGRIRAVKFKGVPSEGFFIPITCLDYIFENSTLKEFENLAEGIDFDKILSHEICRKYIPKGINLPIEKKNKSDKKVVKKFDKLLPEQFRLHNDTSNLRRNIRLINPEDTISLSNKLHGSSWVVGNVLTKKPLGKIKNFLKKFIPEINDTLYDIIYASRCVIKNKYINSEANGGYYGADLWGDIAKLLEGKVLEGFTLYGEVVGMLQSGGWIQKNYDYGCRPNTYEIYVYRITHTNQSGKMIELSWPQIKDYCNKFEIKHVPEFYYGKAKDYCPEIPIGQHWQENFLNKLEKDFIQDKDCSMCNNKVPAEGIVLSVETLWERSSYKLKNFRFLGQETKALDNGEVDIESEQSFN